MLEGQKFFDLLGEMAGLAFPVKHLALMLGRSVMAAEAVIERSGAKVRTFRMIGMPRFTVAGDMSAGNDDWVALDWLVVDDAGMAGRTTLALRTSPEGLHVFTMAHNQTDIFDRRRQITSRHFRNTKNMSMTAQADLRMNLRLQIMRIRRRPEQIDSHIFGPSPGLILYPSLHTGPDMAGNTGYLPVRRLRPTLVGRGDVVATCTELGMVCEGNGYATERNSSGHECKYYRSSRLPAHAPIGNVAAGNAS